MGSSGADDHREFHVRAMGEQRRIKGCGNGPVASLVDALSREFGWNIRVLDFSEHAVGTGADASAVAYVEAQGATPASLWGVGRHTNIATASLLAVVSALNRMTSEMRGQ